MTALRRSVLFERTSNVASNDNKQTSSENQTSDLSGVHPRVPEKPAESARKPSLYSLEFLQGLVENALMSRI